MKFLPSLFLFKIALKILLDKVLKTKLSLLVDKKYLLYKALFFYPEYKKKTFFLLILPKKKNKDGKWPFLDKNHGLTPLENFEFFHFFKTLFFLSRKHSILSRIMPNSFCLILQKKNNHGTWPFFDKHHGQTPLETEFQISSLPTNFIFPM